MANDSATGGPLTPELVPAPLEDIALDDFLHDLIVGITGLDNTLVRPRWQPEPANLPDVGTNWVAFGIVSKEADTYAVEQHIATGQGFDYLKRQEVLNIFCSFYGPQAGSYAELLRDGLQIAQNREVLQLNMMGLVETKETITAPSLVKDKWLFRVDLMVRIRRQILRQYPVLNVLSAQGTIDVETFIDDIETP